jgi:hypothetical protein
MSKLSPRAASSESARAPLGDGELMREIAAWKLHLPYCTWGWYDDQPLTTQRFAFRALVRMMAAGAFRAAVDSDPWLVLPGCQVERKNALPRGVRVTATARRVRDRAPLDMPSTEERLEVFQLEQAFGRHRPH